MWQGPPKSQEDNKYSNNSNNNNNNRMVRTLIDHVGCSIHPSFFAGAWAEESSHRLRWKVAIKIIRDVRRRIGGWKNLPSDAGKGTGEEGINGPSWQLTYLLTSRHFFRDDFPFPQVGYYVSVSSLEGICVKPMCFSLKSARCLGPGSVVRKMLPCLDGMSIQQYGNLFD